jgi:hypothetical protein
MTKYTVAASQRGPRTQAKDVAPIWRGIGCAMMVIIPIVSFLIAEWFVGFAIEQGWAIPYQLLGNPVMPPVLYQTGLAPVAGYIASQSNLYAVLAVTVLLVVIFGGLISLVYALIYQAVGPSRYGPLDVEAPRGKLKRYKR